MHQSELKNLHSMLSQFNLPSRLKIKVIFFITSYVIKKFQHLQAQRIQKLILRLLHVCKNSTTVFTYIIHVEFISLYLNLP